MGQEASIPSKGEETASPQAVAAPQTPETAAAAIQPQAKKKPLNNNGTASASSSSIMSRAGLTSMIQRMGGPKEKKDDETVHAANGLVERMNELSIDRTQTQQPDANLGKNHSDEDDWEKAWAEDSESDEEEETKDALVAPPITPAAGSLRLDAISPVGHTVSENFRPETDGGFANMGSGIDMGGDLGITPKLAERAAVSPEPETEQQQIEPEEWEGYHHELEETTEPERPCVDMFDPALRVLGRGSFGRVSQESIWSAAM